MKPKQLRLRFNAEVCVETRLRFKDDGDDDAVNVLEELFRRRELESTKNSLVEMTVTFDEMAAKRCGLEFAEKIPAEFAEDFTFNKTVIRDNSLHIKALFEERHGILLVMIGQNGKSARLNGRGLAYGFALRDSEVGLRDDLLQSKMAIGLLKAAARRSPKILDDPKIQAILPNPTLIADKEPEGGCCHEVYEKDLPQGKESRQDAKDGDSTAEEEGRQGRYS